MMAFVVPQTPIQLYRHLLKRIRTFPVGVQDHYRHFVRQQFNSHSDEDDPQRIRDIIKQAIYDFEWLERKYLIKATSPDQA